MKQILIIEDEAQTRRNIATILRMEDYEPLLAADEREGVEATQREHPALIPFIFLNGEHTPFS